MKQDILIIGGGIIGASLAYYLADKGAARVTLVEANSELAATGTASAASAGIVSPASNPQTPLPLLNLTQRSLALYPQLIAQLQTEQPQLPTGYQELGQLSLAANSAEVRGLQKRQQWFLDQKLELRAQWLPPHEVSALEPLAGPNAGALLQPVALVRPAWLTKALLAAAQQKGVTLHTGNPVGQLTFNPTEKKVTGVKLKNGDILQAETVVMAAGCWSGLWLDQQLASFKQTATPTPDYAHQIYPVRGQMLAVQLPPNQTPLQHVLVGGHGYALPRVTPDGTNLVAFGATEEHASGFAVHQTPEGYRELGLLVHKLTPALEKSPIHESWAGLRPGSKSELPWLGPFPALPGLWLASGHFRSGVLLAPATAELLSAALLDGSTETLARLQPFAPAPPQ